MTEGIAETDPGLSNGTIIPADFKIKWGFCHVPKTIKVNGKSEGFLRLRGGFDETIKGRYLGGNLKHVIQNLKDYYDYEGSGFDVFQDCINEIVGVIGALKPYDPQTPYKMFYMRNKIKILVSDYYDFFHKKFKIRRENKLIIPNLKDSDKMPSRYMKEMNQKRRSDNAENH